MHHHDRREPESQAQSGPDPEGLTEHQAPHRAVTGAMMLGLFTDLARALLPRAPRRARRLAEAEEKCVTPAES
ncbi:hypothetical protein ACQB60_39255 [Actinomycetota bacterium Odt1-20B]